MMIGTSYRPQSLPQRISGCFIHEVAMTTPSLEERVDILEGLSKNIITAPGECTYLMTVKSLLKAALNSFSITKIKFLKFKRPWPPVSLLIADLIGCVLLQM